MEDYSNHILELENEITRLKKELEKANEAEEIIQEGIELNKALLDLTETVSTILDRDEMLRRVSEAVPKVVDAERCSIFLWNDEQNSFLPAHVWGMPQELKAFFLRLKLPPDIPVAANILKGEKMIIDDVRDNLSYPREMTEPFAVRSVMAFPITGKDKVIGFINVERIGIPRPFGKKEKLFLKGVTHQISISLDNLRLYREMMEKTIELSQRVETLRIMYEIDRNIVSSLETQDILENVVQMVSRIVPSDRVTVVHADRERGGFVYQAGYGVSFYPKNVFVPFADTSAAEVVNRGISQFVSDLTLENNLLPLEKRFMEDGFRSHIRVPLTVKGEVVGVLNVGSRSVGIFTPVHLKTLEGLASQIAVALENARLVSDLKELLLGVVRTLSAAIDAKSPWTAGHSERVTMYSIAIAREMGLDEQALKDLELAGLLHDVGKIGTYDVILDKPGNLVEEEIKIIQKHPAKGADILSSIKQLKDIIPVIRHHHEFYNGAGYPDGLTGESIPLMSRILTVADTLDAMGSDRPYRKGKPLDAIEEELKKCSGTQFDPKVVESFLRIKTQVEV